MKIAALNFAAVAALAMAAFIPAPAAAADISGIWRITAYSAKIHAIGGGELPFTPQGLDAYRKTIAGLKDGSIIDKTRKYCLPEGLPRLLGNPYPFQIFQSAGYVTIVYEFGHVFRTIPLDRRVPADDELAAYPYYSGNSYGHWEGYTLVVVSKGFNDKTFLDATGVPHSDRLHVTERIRALPGGKTLEDVATVEDPETFTRPWSARFVYTLRPGLIIDTSFTCGDPHRELASVKGARNGD